METRKITIVSTKTHSKKVIETNAETLAELKTALNANNIDYADMTFMEGLSQTELINDDSQLPKDVKRTNPQTGEVTTTNELVFLLTNTNKKITSGMTRKEIYHEIKAFGLESEVKAQCGKNYTQVASEKLMEIINSAREILEEEMNKDEYGCNDNVECCHCEPTLEQRVAALERIVNNLVSGKCNCTKEKECPYSDEEIEKMFNF